MNGPVGPIGDTNTPKYRIIQPAIKAIQNTQKEEEVTNLTDRILKKIPRHIEEKAKIISKIAKMNLSPAEWNTLIEENSNIYQEANNADQLTEILEIIDQIPKENLQDFLSMISSSAIPAIPIENRIKILSAIIAAFNLTSTGNATFSYNSFSYNSFLDDSYSDRLYIILEGVTKLTNPEMDVEDTIKIIKALASFQTLPSDKFCIILEGAKYLTKAEMNVEDKIKIINAIASFQKISFEEQIVIIGFSKFMINPEMNAEDRISILDAITALQADEREIISKYTSFLVTPEMNAEDRISILDAITALQADEREIISEYTIFLMNPEMNTQNRLDLLSYVQIIPSDLRQYIPDYIPSPANLPCETILLRLLELYACQSLDTSGSISRSNYVVNIDQLKANPKKVFEELIDTFDQKKSFPKITYANSPGVDVGGLARNLVSDLMRALLANTKTLPILESEKGLLPQIQNADQCKTCQSIGMIFAAALNEDQSILTGVQFNPVLFQMLHSLSQEDLDQIPENFNSLTELPKEIQNKLLKIYLESELSLVFGETGMTKEDLALAINDFIENGTINSWMSTFGIVDLKEFIDERDLNKIVLATLMIAKSMQLRINNPNGWESIKGHSTEKLQTKIEGGLNRKSVIKALNFLVQDVEIKGFLEDWIRLANDTQLKDLIFCITGSNALQENRKLDIQLDFVYGDHLLPKKLPKFHTCFFRMDLPKYDSYEEFKNKLELSIATIIGGLEEGLTIQLA